MNRILVWHDKDCVATNTRIGPTHYINAEYEKVAVRIYAEKAPLVDAKFDIFNNGVSIFSNRTSRAQDIVTGADITGDDDTTIVLTAGQNSEELAENFTGTPIEKDTWIYCDLVNAGNGKNFTVQLELRQLSEDDEPED